MVGMSPTSDFSHPPKPSLSLRVGVVGHRPHRLSSADLSLLSLRIKEILSTVKNSIESYKQRHSHFFRKDNSVTCRAISPLAEGADRIFAEVALDLNYSLICPLPFSKEIFEKDFQPQNALEKNSLERFRRLIDSAESIFEMDGDRSASENAYQACSRIVINQSDLLVAIWDGKHEGKMGGTEETIGIAIERGIPVVLVDAQNPHQCQILFEDTSIGIKEIKDRYQIPDKNFKVLTRQKNTRQICSNLL
jgi:nucleoside 2-deoxyribosyltransferase